MKQGVFLAVTLFFLLGIPFVCSAGDVNINIGVAPPPPPPPPPPYAEGEPAVLPSEQFAQPPDVVAIPSEETTVYMVPNTAGLYFYDDYWYRYNGGYWYRATFYNGPWIHIGATIVPGVVVAVPPEYIFYLPRGYHRIHYHDFHRHWREWNRSRHWRRYDWYRHELRHDVRRDRYRRIEMERKTHHRRVEERRPPQHRHEDMRKDGRDGRKDGGHLHKGGGHGRDDIRDGRRDKKDGHKDGKEGKKGGGQKTHPDDRREMERR